MRQAGQEKAGVLTPGVLLARRSSRSSSKREADLITFSNIVTITVTRCLSSFFSPFLQRLVQEFLALFRFTETDACAILSAYGFYPFEINPLQSDRPKQAESASEGKDRPPPANGTACRAYSRRYPSTFHLGKLENKSAEDRLLKNSLRKCDEND